jgi:hypothetical protein
MVGRVAIKGEYDPDGIQFNPHEGDAAGVVSNSSVKIPALTRPDGSRASASRTLVNEVPMSASADSGRDRKPASKQVASRDSKSKPMLQRASFFGMNGGSGVVKR